MFVEGLLILSPSSFPLRAPVSPVRKKAKSKLTGIPNYAINGIPQNRRRP